MEAEVLELGRLIRSHSRPSSQSLFDGLMDAAMEDEGLKADLFRLLDVLPVLSSDDDVSRHVREYLLGKQRRVPPILGAALKAAGARALSGLSAAAVRGIAGQMAERFIVGASVSQALLRLYALHRNGFAFSADLLGESTVGNSEAEQFCQRYAALIQALSRETLGWEEQPIVDAGPRGAIPRANISLKLSSLLPRLDPLDHERSVDCLVQRMKPLFLAAAQNKAALTIDMEQWDLHGIAWDVFETLVGMRELASWPHFGIVVQAYLHSASDDARRLLAAARGRGTPLAVRLVKGAYWDFEVAHAAQHGYPCPVLVSKGATDASFESLSELFLANTDLVYPGIGSHNLRSLSHALVAARHAGAPAGSFELQCLYGMADAQRQALKDLGYRVRVYAPVGELLPGIAYLVRRLLENSANTGFLRQSTHDGVPIEDLLKAPHAEPSEGDRGAWTDARFRNCPHADFTDGEVRLRFARALQEQARLLPITVPVSAAARERADGRQLRHLCPGNTAREATRVTCSTAEDVEAAVETARNAWPPWRDAGIEERAALLERLADVLERDRFELAALQCREVGKPVREADADVTEAVDMCRYYASVAQGELGVRRLPGQPGEDNVMWHEGRGVAAVISPWNFPLAILCGMTAANLVSGNTVIMKPAEQSSAVAWRLFKAAQEAGFPPGVLQLLPGPGEEVGAQLVSHPLVAQVAFTGSRHVGLEILAAAGRAKPGQRQIKRVVCEMGGKNAIIVDDDADCDEAVAGILRSAFGYAGQKCSACSRLVVLERIYDTLMPRLLDAVKSIRVRPPEDPSCEMGPVIDQAAFRRLESVIREPGTGVELLFKGTDLPPGGWYVPPVVLLVHDASSPVAREELFGPILAVMKVPSFESALEHAVESDYALTGGLYSRSPSRIETARRAFRVGNLYVNHEITGAMVGRQPFGGFSMSGGGTKAGGPGYLLNFADPRVVTENTMRRGFVI